MEDAIDISIKDSIMNLFTCKSLRLYEWASIFSFFTFIFLGVHALCRAVFYHKETWFEDSYSQILCYVAAALILIGAVATFIETHLRQWGIYVGCLLYALQRIIEVCDKADPDEHGEVIAAYTFNALAVLILSNIDFIYGGPYVRFPCLTIKNGLVVTLSAFWLCISLFIILWGAAIKDSYEFFDGHEKSGPYLYYASGSTLLVGTMCMLITFGSSFDFTKKAVYCHMIITAIGVFLFLLGWSFNTDAHYETRREWAPNFDSEVAEYCFLTLALFCTIGFDFYFLGIHQIHLEAKADPELGFWTGGSKIPTDTPNTTTNLPPSYKEAEVAH